MSRLAFSSPLDRREVAEEIYHSPYIGDTLTPDGDAASGGVSVLSRATVATVEAGEATAGFADTSMPLHFDYPAPGVTGCRDTFSVTLHDLDPDAIYALDIADDQTGPWSSWVYLSLRNAPEADFAAGRRTITLNNDYNGLKWFRARRTSPGSLVPLLGDEIIASPAKPLASAIAAPSISIANLTDITSSNAPGSEGGAYLRLTGNFDMPISVLEARRFPVGDVSYYRVSKKYAGRELDQNSFGDLSGTPTVHHPVTAIGDAGSVTKWTRDGSDPTINTVIETLDGVAANAAAHRADFAMVIKARSFAGGCQSPLTIVAVDRGTYEAGRVTVHLTGESIVSACDLPRQEQAYGYHDDGAGNTVWGPLPGIFATVESGNSCNNLWTGTGPFDAHIKLLAKGGTALGGGSPALIYDTGILTTEDQVDWLGWTNHVASARAFVVASTDYARPTSYDSFTRCYNWFLAGSELAQQVIIVNFGTDLTGGGSLGGSSDPIPAADIGAALGDAALSHLVPSSPGDTPGLYHLTRFDSIWSCLPHPLPGGNPRDDFWSDPIDGEPAAPALPPGKDSGLFTNYDDFEAYDSTSNADAATLNGGDGFGSAWSVVSWTSLSGFDDLETYAEGNYSGALPLGGEGFDNIGWTLQDGASGTIYLEDFESYAEQVLNPAILGLEGGTGFGSAWYFPAALDGVEDFEAFADGYTFPSNATTAVASGDSSFIGTWFTSALPGGTQTFFDGLGHGVAGLIGLWRANDITGHTDGDALAKWLDSSGNTYDLYQTTAGNRPTYKENQINTSLPAVRFDAASSKFFNAPSFLTCLGAADLFMVFKVDAQPTPSTLHSGIYRFGGDTHTNFITLFPFTDNNVYNSFMTDARKATGSKSGLTSWNLLETWSAPGDWAQLFNGTSHFATATNGLDFSGGVTVGGDVTQPVYMDGLIAEILIFDHKLTTAERTVVKNYVAAKYGLTIA